MLDLRVWRRSASRRLIRLDIRIAECLCARRCFRAQRKLRLESIFQLATANSSSQHQFIRRHAVEHDAAHTDRDSAWRIAGPCACRRRRRPDRIAAHRAPGARLPDRAWQSSWCRCADRQFLRLHRGRPASAREFSRSRCRAGVGIVDSRLAVQRMRSAGAALIQQQDVAMARSGARARRICGYVSVADWPGPPAMNTTMSRAAACASLRIRASFRSSLRPSGLSQFSGTGIGAQNAAVVAPEFFWSSSHGANFE